MYVVYNIQVGNAHLFPFVTSKFTFCLQRLLNLNSFGFCTSLAALNRRFIDYNFSYRRFINYEILVIEVMWLRCIQSITVPTKNPRDRKVITT